jgi:AcrR family transcriptional regulator
MPTASRDRCDEEISQGVTETNAPNKPAARERPLAAAAELFHEERVQSVGVDKVTERAGVTKASMYKIFGSKDGLVRAYLEQRHERTKTRMNAELADRFATPRDKLLGVFEVQGQVFGDPGFRGCVFVSASAEAQPGSGVENATRDYRAWLHDLFVDLARQAGAEPRERSFPRALRDIWPGTRLRPRVRVDRGLPPHAGRPGAPPERRAWSWTGYGA